MEKQIVSEFNKKAKSLIYTYSDKIVLSKIPFLTPDIIQANFNKRWDLDSILQHSYLTMSLLTFLKNNITEGYCWPRGFNIVCQNTSISISIVKEFRNELDILNNAEKIVSHATLDIVKFIIDEYGDSIPELFEWISRNPNVNDQFVYRYYDNDWNWSLLSRYMQMSEDFIRDNDFAIDFVFLANNPSLTSKIFEKYHNKVWNWILLSKNPSIMTLEFYKKYTHIIEKTRVCRYSKYIMEIIDDNPDGDWNWKYVSINKNINIEFVKRYQHKSLDFSLLSSNSGIQLDDIINNYSISWNWKYISRHPNLTICFITRYSYKDWDWDYINNHQSFSIEIQDTIKGIAATTIQRQLKICMYNPNYKMCWGIMDKKYDDTKST